MTILSLIGQSRGLGLSPRRRAASNGGAGPPGDTEAPSVPQNLSATAIWSDQIDLTWDASTDNVGVTGYNIYRDNLAVDTSPTNSYSDIGLDPGTEYDYEVSAVDAASNESARSNPDSASTHQVIVADGSVAEWRFDQGAGQVLTDHTGKRSPRPARQHDRSGCGRPGLDGAGVELSFDGGDFVEHGPVGISGGAARTVLAVVKPGPSATFGLEWPGTGTRCSNAGPCAT